jgi:hypothetical protein
MKSSQPPFPFDQQGLVALVVLSSPTSLETRLVRSDLRGRARLDCKVPLLELDGWHVPARAVQPSGGSSAPTARTVAPFFRILPGSQRLYLPASKLSRVPRIKSSWHLELPDPQCFGIHEPGSSPSSSRAQPRSLVRPIRVVDIFYLPILSSQVIQPIREREAMQPGCTEGKRWVAADRMSCTSQLQTPLESRRV